jgi:hypothetical protein
VKWVEKILHPPSRLTKIGVRPEWHAAILGAIDNDFVDELRSAIASLSVGRTVNAADAIFVGLAHPSDFQRVAAAKSAIKIDGAVWLIRPKGSAAVTEGAHSALKFVIPAKDRSHKSGNS